VALGAISQRTSGGIANLVGEQHHAVDEAPDDCADAAGEKADDELRDTEAGVTQVDATDPDESEQA
jgi:hypothetical protein